VQACLADEIIPGLQAEGHDGCLLFYTPVWHYQVAELLAPVKSVPILRQYYERNLGGELPEVILPDGIILREVDADLLEKSSIEGLEALREEMLSERVSVEEFLAKSFGVVALAGRILAGWCLSEYNCAQRCEVGIGTQEPFRRRGLAHAMGLAFLRQASHNGITRVGWDCFAENTPSIATALRLGFEKVEEFPATVFWF
jgi:GNAT superfamily N-acetyltransferase